MLFQHTFHARARRLRRHRRREGMTLVEIMIVVIIMAMIATAVGMSVIPAITKARRDAAKTNAATLRSGVALYRVQGGDGCPSMDDLLEADVIDSATTPEDPWGEDFLIECEGTQIAVYSAGQDRTFGTEDDVPD